MGLDDFGHGLPARWELTSKLSDPPSTWYIADFGLYGWPEARIGSYMNFRQKAQETEHNTPWRDKIPKLVSTLSLCLEYWLIRLVIVLERRADDRSAEGAVCENRE